MNNLFKKKSETSVEFTVYLTPGSSREKINGTYFDENGEQFLKVSVFARPENNSANDALIRLLSKFFSIPKTQIAIRFGQKSRKKVILIEKINPENFLNFPIL
jgi:uncharacterized protein (TIGR00251 family)